MGELTKAQQAVWDATLPKWRADVNWREGKYQVAILDFVAKSLASADDDGVILSPGTLDAYGTYVQMLICGWINWPEKGLGNGWTITEAGRQALRPTTRRGGDDA